MITNEPGWDPKYQVVNNGDGTFDIVYVERTNARPEPIKKNLDPTNPDHKRYWDDALLGGSQPVSSGIDTNSI